jgi:hypothetical protein
MSATLLVLSITAAKSSRANAGYTTAALTAPPSSRLRSQSAINVELADREEIRTGIERMQVVGLLRANHAPGHDPA